MTLSTQRSLCLVVNGESAGDPALRIAVAEIRDRGYPLDVHVTWEGGDAARYASQAANGDFDVLPRRLSFILPPDAPLSAAVAE